MCNENNGYGKFLAKWILVHWQEKVWFGLQWADTIVETQWKQIIWDLIEIFGINFC